MLTSVFFFVQFCFADIFSFKHRERDLSDDIEVIDFVSGSSLALYNTFVVFIGSSLKDVYFMECWMKFIF